MFHRATHFSGSSSVYLTLDSDYNYKPSTEDVAEESEHESPRPLETDLSSQTFATYVTANGLEPSFTLINESLLKSPDIDVDETPKLEPGPYDPVDATPVLNGHVFDAEPEVDVDSVALKFQRLSVTLLQTAPSVSRESNQFHTTFSLNIQSNNQKRSSSYYSKIRSKPRSPELRQDEFQIELPHLSEPDAQASLAASSLDAQSSVLDTTPDLDVRLSLGSVSSLEMSTLFVKALHLYEAPTDPGSVCLSFEKDEMAFVHTIDDSGWGEVTLLDSLDRGWIPMNYFAMAVDNHEEPDAARARYAQYMEPLLNACGRFLVNPLLQPGKKGKTFSIKIVNAIRDGVRSLLQETDCLSRSNEIVTKKPVVRKARKSLLSDWYLLMMKAGEYKGTSNYDKIEILTLLVLQVVRRALKFFEIWAEESSDIIRRETELKLQNDINNLPLLASLPLAKQRVLEINSVLLSYLAIIMGRLDMVEHNPLGRDVLETVTHHTILLLRELLFISKTGSDYSLEKPPELDASLDALLSLVSELVAGVKSLVVSTVSEGEQPLSEENEGEYQFTAEGRHLRNTAAKMVRAISSTVACIRRLFDVIGDFKLSSERSYPDYAKMRVEPADFISKCSVGLVKLLSLKNNDLRAMKRRTKTSNRFSAIRTGAAGSLGISDTGVHILHRVMLEEPKDAPFSLDTSFQPFINSDAKDGQFSIQDELLIDSEGNLLGASLKGLVYTLTNEQTPPEYFFVSTFFICSRSFASGGDFLELLINRFDASSDFRAAQRIDALTEVRVKNRRRLICKMFQIWMELYWQAVDNPLLTTLINFFNEGVLPLLPLEAMKLIEVAAKLFAKTSRKQLVTRHITLAKINRRKNLLTASSLSTSLSSRYSMVDGYELSRINTNSSVAASLKSMSLPMPLGVGLSTNTSLLLTKNQVSHIEGMVMTFRSILKDAWCNGRVYLAEPLEELLPKWASLHDQSWVLSNYRPNLLDYNGLEIAKQLTLIESEIFCSVLPEELLNGNFTTKKAHLKRAENVRLCLLFTNCLSAYVLESILQPSIAMKQRINITKTWLKIAISCLYLRNFNSLAGIITAMQSHLVTRLPKLWEGLSEKYIELYDYLSGIVHPEKNYRVYRNKLKSFLFANDYNIPVVPYFSLFLQDLTFVTEGNSNFRKANTFLGQKLINIDKYLKITRIIADIESLQVPYEDARDKRFSTFSVGKSEEYQISAVPVLQEFILLELWKVSQLNSKEEDRAWKLSCGIEQKLPSG